MGNNSLVIQNGLTTSNKEIQLQHIKVINKYQNLQFITCNGEQLLKLYFPANQQNAASSYINKAYLQFRKQRVFRYIPNTIMFGLCKNQKKYFQQKNDKYAIFSHPHRSLGQQMKQRIELSQRFQQKQIITILYSCINALQEITNLIKQFFTDNSSYHLQSLNISEKFIFINKNGSVMFSDLMSIGSSKNNLFKKQRQGKQNRNSEASRLCQLVNILKICLIQFNYKKYQINSISNSFHNYKIDYLSADLQNLIEEIQINKINTYEKAKIRLSKLTRFIQNNQNRVVLKQKKQFLSQNKNISRNSHKSNLKNQKICQNPTKIRLSLKKISCQGKRQYTNKQNNCLKLQKYQIQEQKTQLKILNKQNKQFSKQKQLLNSNQSGRQSYKNQGEIHKLKSRKQSIEKPRKEDYNCDKKQLDISEHFNPITSKNMLKNHFLKKDRSKKVISCKNNENCNYIYSKQNQTKQVSDDKFNSIQINPLSIQLIQNLSSIMSNHGSITLSLSNALNDQMKTQNSQNHQEQIQKAQINKNQGNNQMGNFDFIKKCEEFIKQSKIKNNKNWSQKYCHTSSQKFSDETQEVNKIPQFLKKFKLPQKNLLALNNFVLNQKNVIMEESFEQSQLNSYRQTYEDQNKKGCIKRLTNECTKQYIKRVQISKIQIKVLQESCQFQDYSKDSIQKQIIGLQNSLQELNYQV